LDADFAPLLLRGGWEGLVFIVVENIVNLQLNATTLIPPYLGERTFDQQLLASFCSGTAGLG
jgi:hypothetical protein